MSSTVKYCMFKVLDASTDEFSLDLGIVSLDQALVTALTSTLMSCCRSSAPNSDFRRAGYLIGHNKGALSNNSISHFLIQTCCIFVRRLAP